MLYKLMYVYFSFFVIAVLNHALWVLVTTVLSRYAKNIQSTEAEENIRILHGYVLATDKSCWNF